jgi:WD40 repeat protein
MKWIFRYSSVLLLVLFSSIPLARGEPTPKAGVDLHGDSLPPGVVARFGTVRLRSPGGALRSALSPDGSLLAFAGTQVWDLKAGQELERFKGKLQARAVSFSADGKTLYAAGQDTLEHWDVSSGKLLRTIPAENGGFEWFRCFSHDGSVLVIVGPTKILCFDAASGEQRPALEPKEDFEFRSLSSDGKFLTTTAPERRLRLWNTRTGKVDRTVTFKKDWEPHPAFGADGQLLAVVRDGQSIRFLDTASGKETLKVAIGGEFLVFSPDRRKLVVDRDDSVVLVDAANSKIVLRLPDDCRSVLDRSQILFSADGRWLAVMSNQFNVRVWDTTSGKEMASPPGHRSPVNHLAFSPDGKSLASGGESDGTLIVWDMATSRVRHVWTDHYHGVIAVAWSPDGKMLASGEGDPYSDDREASIRLFDLRTGQREREFKAHLNRVVGLDFSPDGRQLASVGADARARIWDASTGARLQQLRGDDGLTAVAYARDGKALLLSTNGGKVEAYRTADWELAHRQVPSRTHYSEVLLAGLLADGRTVVLRELVDDPKPGKSESVELRFRSVATGKVLRSIRLGDDSPEAHVAPYALSLSGDLYATSWEMDKEFVVRVWDTATGKQLITFKAHVATVTALAFSHDNRWLAAGGNDTTILLWDLSEMRLQFFWAELAADSRDGVGAVKLLATAPANAFSWLATRLRQVAYLEAKAAPVLARLDDADFDTRERASAELAALGVDIRPVLEMALAARPSPEKRVRIEGILQKFPEANPALTRFNASRMQSAVRLLERMATPESRQVLETLAKAPAESLLARAAEAALQCMKTPNKEERR